MALLVAPGSQIAFDFFVGDFRINIHDRLSSARSDRRAGLSNTVDYGRLENYAGLSVLWDLNQILLTVGYDHYNLRFDYIPVRLPESTWRSRFTVRRLSTRYRHHSRSALKARRLYLLRSTDTLNDSTLTVQADLSKSS